MLKCPVTARLAALAFLVSAVLTVLTGCSGGSSGGSGVNESVSTAVQNSSSAIATSRLVLQQISDGRLTRAASSTALDDALKELQTSRDTVAKLAPGTGQDRDTVAAALEVLDGCAAALSTARNAVASSDGTPAIADGSRELAAAADRLAQLSAKEGGK
ncbi:hypothetical protein PY310_03480 [Pseudarthrobacter sp. H3Y2-7]|uniref:hypothetical protein n=1 Tax=Pseudarthrobacter naphthalenicus TaxID=3031328 RepID=UPI0023AEDFBE|nr:hypothetical protein [Pseudarthrobacter sp. H3Y2-7]MDE8667641.1 hypothetical protein [Pseudarthrobacter sp. H3Y2-7]